VNSKIAPDLSIVVPTLNEAHNIGRLIPRLQAVLDPVRGGSFAYEILVCDDASPDGTADIAESLRARPQGSIRVLRLTAPFGLGRAIMQGFSQARGRYLAVIDADLQHDETILPTMIEKARSHDLVIGSRYEFMGAVAGWSKIRETGSRAAAYLTRQILRTSVRDPLSGYFLMTRDLYDGVRQDLRPQGWKILLEILGHAPRAKFAEVPFTFRPRTEGRSKMSWQVGRDWLSQLRRLRRQQTLPIRPIVKIPEWGLAREGRVL
jgi:dolichol-phosphate mannosyltransferase